MMCPGTGPTVMDFGLARQTAGGDQRLTQSGTALGTPAYMPPEQVLGQSDRIGPASDVYNLGMILYELLTGRLPFEAANVVDLFDQIRYAEPTPPSKLQPGVSPALDAICARALKKQPGERYGSMKALIADLAAFLKATPATEGAGKLVPVRPATAEILEAQTVPPVALPVAQPATPPRSGRRSGSKSPPLPEALPAEAHPAPTKRRSDQGSTVRAGPTQRSGCRPEDDEGSEPKPEGMRVGLVLALVGGGLLGVCALCAGGWMLFSTSRPS
jgi:serine/threonine-protein kinase